MLRNVKTETLMGIAAVGGFLTAGMGYALRNKINKNITNTEYYKEATDILKEHPGALYILGKPIKFGAIDVSDTKNNWTANLSAHYEVPVKGTKQKGVLYFWAEKSIENKWNVIRMELGLENEPNKRLLVKNTSI